MTLSKAAAAFITDSENMLKALSPELLTKWQEQSTVDEAMKHGARQVESPKHCEYFAAFLQETRDGTDNDDLSQCCDFIVVEILKDDGWLAIVKRLPRTSPVHLSTGRHQRNNNVHPPAG